MILKNLKSFGYLKRRPKSHRLESITTVHHEGFVLASYPAPYPMTSQQKKVKDAAKACGIHKGMSRGALVTAMTDCVPGKF
jgi:hypothetical protein